MKSSIYLLATVLGGAVSGLCTATPLQTSDDDYATAAEPMHFTFHLAESPASSDYGSPAQKARAGAAIFEAMKNFFMADQEKAAQVRASQTTKTPKNPQYQANLALPPAHEYQELDYETLSLDELSSHLSDFDAQRNHVELMFQQLREKGEAEGPEYLALYRPLLNLYPLMNEQLNASRNKIQGAINRRFPQSIFAQIKQ